MKPFFSIAACGIMLQSLALSFSVAQEPPTSPPQPTANAEVEEGAAESAAIRKASEAFVAAFKKKDAKAISELWTENGEFIDDAGRRLVGRQAIEQAYADFFAGNTEAEIRIMIDSVRLLGDTTAIEDGRSIVDPAPAGAPGFSKYTAVHVKVEGKWLMASVRDTWVEIPAALWSGADLEWLVGTWVAEEHGVKIESVVRWVADHRFLQRSYTSTQLDGTTSSGIQLIGWNPERGQLQSWNFSPDGGHAVGIWYPHPGGWTAEMRGVTGEGTLTTAFNSLTRLDDNAYVWQSVHRVAGGNVLSDTDEVVLKRQPTPR